MPTKKKPAAKKRPRVTPGRCRKCGCTDYFACQKGCAWVDAEHTRCSACFPDALE